MSTTLKAGPLDWRQRHANDVEVMETHLDGRQAQIHTAMPGTIVSYDPATMTVVVQPSIQGMHQKLDGKVEPVTISTIGDVPVHFPSGGGHTMTFPISPGDECLIMFSERNIDNWFQHGGVQQPRDYRMHDMNDAFVLVGLKSQPNSLSGASTNAVQLRSNDGSTVISLDGGAGSVEITTGDTSMTMQKGGQVKIDCITLTVTGEIRCFSEVTAQSNTGGFVTLSKHTNHQGGGQNNPPKPGT